MIRASIGFTPEGVEKAPGAPPTAFRIWKAGDNVTDYGVHKFTPRSAELLMAEQAIRGNRYSIDVDHLSTKDTAPPEARKAVGFHSLGVRPSPDGPELWAEAAEWTAAVASGLAVDPPGVPEWKYFSPWYDVDKKTDEIVSYKNTALTNNPATHHTTVLASRIAATKEGHTMKFKEAMAALFGEDEEKKAAAKKCIEAMFGEGEEKPEDKKEEKKEEKPEEKKDAKASEDKPAASDDKSKELPAKDAKSAKSAKAGEGDMGKDEKETAAALASMGAELRENSEWRKQKEAEEATKARAAVKATRPDLPETFWSSVEKLPLPMVEKAVAAIPKSKANPASVLGVAATRGGDGAGEAGTVRAARSAEAPEILGRMGISTQKASIHWDPNHPNDRVFPVIDRKEAVAILARRGDAPPPKRPMLADAREVGR